jgi:hypothetical protein
MKKPGCEPGIAISKIQHERARRGCVLRGLSGYPGIGRPSVWRLRSAQRLRGRLDHAVLLSPALRHSFGYAARMGLFSGRWESSLRSVVGPYYSAVSKLFASFPVDYRVSSWATCPSMLIMYYTILSKTRSLCLLLKNYC